MNPLSNKLLANVSRCSSFRLLLLLINPLNNFYPNKCRSNKRATKKDFHLLVVGAIGTRSKIIRISSTQTATHRAWAAEPLAGADSGAFLEGLAVEIERNRCDASWCSMCPVVDVAAASIETWGALNVSAIERLISFNARVDFSVLSSFVQPPNSDAESSK